MGANHDPLGILDTTRAVVDASRWVRFVPDALPQASERCKQAGVRRPNWNALHFTDHTARTANIVLVQDALNFCFWGEPRWHVIYRGSRYDGYWALVACLRRAIEEDVPLADARFLAGISRGTLAYILRGEVNTRIPMLSARVRHLQEVGRVLLGQWEGEFARVIEAAAADTMRLVEIAVAQFPSFNDVAIYRGEAVRFYKRAQILVGDLAGCFQFKGLGHFSNLQSLTAFADYKVPQVLRRLGLLEYCPDLADRLDRRIEIPMGSEEEIEIRAHTIWAVEELRRALEAGGVVLSAYELDWYLWEAGQQADGADRPYHRTWTVYY